MNKIQGIIRSLNLYNFNNINLYSCIDQDNPRLVEDSELTSVIMSHYKNTTKADRKEIVRRIMKEAPLKETTKITRTLESLIDDISNFKYVASEFISGDKLLGYKDSRSKLVNGMWYVSPVAENNIQQYLVCPICGDIHVHGKGRGELLSQCKRTKLHTKYVIV